MRYMLNTKFRGYLLHRNPPDVLARLPALYEGEVVMSVVMYAELRAGLEMQTQARQHDEQVLALLTQRIPVLAFDAVAALSYGVQRAAVRERRRDALDRFIAAHAVSVRATLVTHNEADFKDLPGLVVENWTLLA